MHESSCWCKASHRDSHTASQLITAAISCVSANRKPHYKAAEYDSDVSVAFLQHFSCVGRTSKEDNQ